MDQLKYRDLFFQIASSLKEIENDPEKNSRFFEELRTFNPVEMTWYSEFQQSLRSRMDAKSGKCLMVLETLEADYRYNGGENKELMFIGCFIILKKVVLGSSKVTAREVSITQAHCMKVSQSILGYIEEHNRRSWESGQAKESIYLDWNSVRFLPVADLEGLAGYRVEFEFKSPANSEASYDADDWNTPL